MKGLHQEVGDVVPITSYTGPRQVEDTVDCLGWNAEAECGDGPHCLRLRRHQHSRERAAQIVNSELACAGSIFIASDFFVAIWAALKLVRDTWKRRGR